MKFLNRLGLLSILSLALVTACEKVPDLPFYNLGVEPVLTSSAATVAPIPADSNKSVLTLDWTSPQYATDSATVRFIVQVDSSGRNFSKAVSKELTGVLTTSFLAKEL